MKILVSRLVLNNTMELYDFFFRDQHKDGVRELNTIRKKKYAS